MSCNFMKTKEVIRLLSAAVYAEAGDKSLACMEAVAAVLINRFFYEQNRGGSEEFWMFCLQTIAEKDNIAEQECNYFSRTENIQKRRAICTRIAKRAVADYCYGNKNFDKTGGALFYHDIKVLPDWAKNSLPLYETDNLLFYGEEIMQQNKRDTIFAANNNPQSQSNNLLKVNGF